MFSADSTRLPSSSAKKPNVSCTNSDETGSIVLKTLFNSYLKDVSSTSNCPPGVIDSDNPDFPSFKNIDSGAAGKSEFHKGFCFCY